MTDCIAEFTRHIENNDDEGLFRVLIRNMIEGHRKDVRVHRVLLFAALEGHQLGLEHARALKQPIFELLWGYITRRQSEGAIRPGQSGAILLAVAGMAAHYETMTQMFGYSGELHRRRSRRHLCRHS